MSGMRSQVSRLVAPERSAALFACSVLLLAASLTIALAPSRGLAAVATTYATADASGTSDASGTPDASATPVASATTPVVSTRTVGHSVRGRAIVLVRFGSGPRHVLLVGGVHGDEYGGSVASKFAVYLRTHPSAIPTGTQVDVIAYANPDGRVLKWRANARKVDLNRNFPARNWTRHRNRNGTSHGRSPGSELETKALIGVLRRGHYARVISLHSRGRLVDYDGPNSRALAKRVAKAAGVRIFRLPSYAGSMGSYVPEKLHTPIITWELSSRKLTKRVRAGLRASLR